MPELRWGTMTRATGGPANAGATSTDSDEEWTPPPKEECWEETVPIAVDTRNQITTRRVEWEGQLVDYAIIHSRKDDDGNWVEVTCIDCAHGTVHRHDGPHHANPAKVI